VPTAIGPGWPYQNNRTHTRRTESLRSLPFRIALVIYDALWAVTVTGWLVFRLLCRRHDVRALLEGLGFLPFRAPTAPVAVWFHAVSVGEFLSTRPVLAALKRQHPDWWVLLTTTHPQAFALARAQAVGADAVCQLPWDFGPCINKALKRVRPDLVVLVECELWPNLVLRSARQGARLLMMNARVYERDLPRYLLGKFLFAPILQQMSYIGAQSAADRSRFLRLGAPPKQTVIAGNTKFDVRLPADLPSRLAVLRALLPLRTGPLLVLASTHDNEEQIILARCRPLWERFPGLQLLIAPRHPSRGKAIKRVAEELGLHAVLRSLPSNASHAPNRRQPEVIILDTIGELPVVLGLADLVFIGGSLVDRGGHNPIEAGLCAKAILIGPSVYNFQEVVAAFRSGQGLVIVRDAEELMAQASDLLGDSCRRERLGRKAAEVVSQHAGTAEAYVGQMAKLVYTPELTLPGARPAA
jgi:3-deoxy-D-manno-octulosonic-acid transferase